MRVLVFLACASLVSVNEAVVSLSHAAQHFSARERYGVGFETMSVVHAVHFLKKMNGTSAELLSVVEQNIEHKGDAVATTTKGPDVQASYGGVMKAGLRLNEMLLASHNQLDVECLRCQGFSRTQHHRIIALEADSQYYSQLVTKGDEDVLNCRTQKSAWGDKIPIAEQELKTHNEECRTELGELHHQLRIAKSDADVMDGILNMTQCNDAKYDATMDAHAQKAGVSLVECVNTRTGKKYKKMVATDPSLKKALSKLQHSKTLTALKSALVVPKDNVKLLQKKTRRLRKAPNSDNYEYEVWEPEESIEGGTPYGQVVINATVDPNLDAGAEKCSGNSQEYLDDFGSSDMCPELRERFVNLAGGIEDAIEELTTMIENKQTKCQQIRKELEAEIEHYNYWYKVWETRLAKAIAQLGEYRTQFKNEYEELRDARSLYATEMAGCEKFEEEKANEICALRTIRNELVRMSYWDSVENMVTDCAVTPEQMPIMMGGGGGSEGGDLAADLAGGGAEGGFGADLFPKCPKWDADTCSQTCGGGVEDLSRIVAQPQGPDLTKDQQATQIWQKGMACPALRARQSCNEHRCPVDCELADWEEWSRCTVTCGGGIRERMRSIMTHPTPNGNPCELTLESEECNSFTCDVDCVLSAWTEWTVNSAGQPSCTKICGGGQRTRVKTLVQAARGHGTCAEFYDPSRFGVKPCNTQPCSYNTDEVVPCIGTVDVILVLDGSGSLGRHGFEQTKKIALRLGGAIRGDGHLAAILYSGTIYSCGRLICVGMGNQLPYRCRYWSGYTLTPYQCGIKWVSHLEPNGSTVVGKMEKMYWPAQNTLTSLAIKSAQNEMVNSRSGVPTVIIVITDGYPYSKLHTEWAAKEVIAQGGRLMMVPVGFDKSDKADFEKYVSYPANDNLILGETFDSLTATNKTLNQIVTNFCTNLYTHGVQLGN